MGGQNMVSNLKKLILCTIFACGVAAPLSGCGNSPESEGPYAPTSENYVYPKTLEFVTQKVTLRVGERLTVKYSISPSGARNDEALWFTSNDTVVYVADGVLMGVGKGTATVTVVVGGLKSSMEVTVIDTGGGDTKSIVLSTNSMKLKVGGSAPIKAYANPATEVVNWASSNEAIAKYENGNIVAVAKGECDITATISDGLYDVCHVTVDDATPGPTPGPDPQGWTGSIRVGAPLGEMQFMRELLDDFNKDTGSTVNFEVTQWEEGNGPDNLPQSLGDGPDIFPYVSVKEML